MLIFVMRDKNNKLRDKNQIMKENNPFARDKAGENWTAVIF